MTDTNREDVLSLLKSSDTLSRLKRTADRVDHPFIEQVELLKKLHSDLNDLSILSKTVYGDTLINAIQLYMNSDYNSTENTNREKLVDLHDALARLKDDYRILSKKYDRLLVRSKAIESSPIFNDDMRKLIISIDEDCVTA